MKGIILSAHLSRIAEDPQKKLWVSWSMLIFLSLIWGSSFILMKRGLVAFSPFQVGTFRILIASVALLPFLALRKISLKQISRKTWWGLTVVGFMGNGFPAILFPLAETRLNSASTGILNALTPMFTLLIGVLFFSMAFTQRKIVGLVLGLIGSVLLVALGGEEIELGEKFSYAGFVLLATICYGITGNVLKKVLTYSDLDAISITALALGIASIPYWAYFALSETYLQFTSTAAWTSFGYIAILGLIGTAFATVIFNHLLKLTDPVFASSVTYLVPIVALMWGLIDGEPMRLLQGLGMGLILWGVYQVNKR